MSHKSYRLDIKYVHVVLMFYVYVYLICDTLIKHLLTYLVTYLVTYLLTYLLTYSLTLCAKARNVLMSFEKL